MKKKKFLATSLIASILTIGSLVPVAAAQVPPTQTPTTPQNPSIEEFGNTKLNIGVVKRAQDTASIDVTVPTVLALVVVAEDAVGADKSPEVLISSTTDNVKLTQKKRCRRYEIY